MKNSGEDNIALEVTEKNKKNGKKNKNVKAEVVESKPEVVVESKPEVEVVESKPEVVVESKPEVVVVESKPFVNESVVESKLNEMVIKEDVLSQILNDPASSLVEPPVSRRQKLSMKMF